MWLQLTYCWQQLLGGGQCSPHWDTPHQSPPPVDHATDVILILITIIMTLCYYYVLNNWILYNHLCASTIPTIYTPDPPSIILHHVTFQTISQSSMLILLSKFISVAFEKRSHLINCHYFLFFIMLILLWLLGLLASTVIIFDLWPQSSKSAVWDYIVVPCIWSVLCPLPSTCQSVWSVPGGLVWRTEPWLPSPWQRHPHSTASGRGE